MTRQGKRVAVFLLVFLICVAAIFYRMGNKYQDPSAVIGHIGEDMGFTTIMGNGSDALSGFLGDFGNEPGEGISNDQKRLVLEKLGYTFTEATERALSYMDEDWDLGYSDFLAMIGMGEFDYASGTEEWTPTCDWVYALDTEVYDVMNMYPQFFRGLLSISGGEIPITDVVQDDSQVNWEEGSGLRRVKLNYAGKPYTIDTQAMMDWLDCSILEKVNDILEQEGASKRYYAMWNNFQGLTILFLTPEGARNFEGATGCRLFTAL